MEVLYVLNNQKQKSDNYYNDKIFLNLGNEKYFVTYTYHDGLSLGIIHGKIISEDSKKLKINTKLNIGEVEKILNNLQQKDYPEINFIRGFLDYASSKDVFDVLAKEHGTNYLQKNCLDIHTIKKYIRIKNKNGLKNSSDSQTDYKCVVNK